MAREEVKAFGSGAKVQEVVTATFLNKWKGRDRVEQTVSDWSDIVEPSATMFLERKFPYVQETGCAYVPNKKCLVMSIRSMEGEKPVSYWGNISPDMAVRFGQTLIELAGKHQSSTSDPSVRVLELVDSLRRSEECLSMKERAEHSIIERS